MEDKKINDLIEKVEEYREGLKYNYEEDLVDGKFRKSAEQFAIDLKNGKICKMFQEFNKLINQNDILNTDNK